MSLTAERPSPPLAAPPVSAALRPGAGPGAARAAVPAARTAGATRIGPGRVSGRAFVVIAAAVGLVAVYATDQIVPATSAHQAELRVWLAARAAGFVALGLLTVQVVLGLVLSHPTNKTTWKLSKALFPWHENAWIFVLAFLGLHVVTIVIDPYAGVGLAGALVPGLSSFQTAPVALGTIALEALLVTGLTARFPKRLPAGWWLKLHRLSLGVLVLAWIHAVLTGTDSLAVAFLYGASFALVLAAAAYRYWVARAGRPTFSTALPEVRR